MTDNAIKRLIDRMTGCWEGEEVIVTDPETGASVNAIGRYVNEPSFNETGIISNYRQTIDEQQSIICVTCILFHEDNSLTATWLSNISEPQRYQGTWREGQFEFSGMDTTSESQFFKYDYAVPNKASCIMSLKLPTTDALTLFSGNYNQLK